MQLLARYLLLASQLLRNQFARNFQPRARMERKSLRTPKAGVRRTNRPGSHQHNTVSFKHHKRGILISKPSKGSERNKSICANNDEASKAVCHTRQPGFAPVCSDSIFQNQVPSVDAHADTVPK